MRTVQQMDNPLRTTILYGFVLILLSGAISVQAGTYLPDDSQNTPHFTILVANLFVPRASGEQFFDDLQQGPSTPTKISFEDYLSVARLTESKRNHLLAKYITFARYKVPRLQSHDIAFPFHYFW